ncbi:hypothetical protein EGW08_017238 [Elysia chlorotica]|uniref:Uncharacterized protein n=1 Tax=Elysia chlorotica TaxID=188477 RepID=A0A3S1B934_ELYCH|nr:hypothetical protein EGW08_017238 [Elysia chlorotica]
MSGVAASYMLTTRKSVDLPKKDDVLNDGVAAVVVALLGSLARRGGLRGRSYGLGYAGVMGNTKEKEELPEKSNMFSDNIPNTNSGNYGNRVNSEAGKAMQSLEFQFFSEGRRKKLPKEMICY